MQAPFRLVPSEELPPGWDPSPAAPELRASARAVLALPAGTDTRAARRAARRLRTVCHRAVVRPFGPDHRASQGNLDNDRFFGVQRVVGDPLTVLTGATAQAYGELLDELDHGGTALETGPLAVLAEGLGSLLAAATGEKPAVLPLPRRAADPARAVAEPLRRWRRGHHVFMAMLQGLAVTAGGLTASLRRPAHEDLAGQWELLITLLDGSSAALRFTGDFAGLDYLSQVRPLMSDPVVPGGMTGLELRDHQQFLTRLKLLGRALAESERPGEAAVRGAARFRGVLARVYTDHGLVCSEFVGADRASLIAAGGPPAVRVLDRLAESRVRLLPDLTTPPASP
ncbi:hypothetical protein, partial [Streptomyces specialis]|uniref:hypothetical protein n=1 Tax=Streptomyces specialis TaxID=498367 RepID=UPI00073F7444